METNLLLLARFTTPNHLHGFNRSYEPQLGVHNDR